MLKAKKRNIILYTNHNIAIDLLGWINNSYSWYKFLALNRGNWSQVDWTEKKHHFFCPSFSMGCAYFQVWSERIHHLWPPSVFWIGENGRAQKIVKARPKSLFRSRCDTKNDVIVKLRKIDFYWKIQMHLVSFTLGFETRKIPS